MSRGFHRLSRRGVGAIGLVLGLVLAAMPAWAQCASNVCTVASATDLVSALTTIDGAPGTYVINITANITLDTGTTLPAITGSANNVTINGANHTIDGGTAQRGFFVYQGTVAINNLDDPEPRWPRAGTAATKAPRRRGWRAGRCPVRGHRRQPVGEQRGLDRQQCLW